MGKVLLLALWLCCAATATAASGSAWESFVYDGTAFVRGATGPAIMVKEGFLPVAAAASPRREDQLPEGTGAVALLCYQESSGGKLRERQRVVPLPAMVVTLTRSPLTVAGRTDHNGYLVLALPPGEYLVHWLGYSKSIKINKGKSTLVALRGGKRMVD